MVDHYEHSKPLDLIVRNGTLVIPGVGQVKADVGIADGKIAVLGTNLAQRTAEVYDATGRTVLPGIFDPHIHLGNEQSYESEAETETRAAILGGVTTVGIFLRSLEDSYFRHVPAFCKAMNERSYVDSIFHPQIFSEQQIEEIPGYAEQYGIRSFKFYMSGIPGIVKSVTDDVLLQGFRTVAMNAGDGAICESSLRLAGGCPSRGGGSACDSNRALPRQVTELRSDVVLSVVTRTSAKLHHQYVRP
jgi:dihydropyrimidinase